MDVRVELVGADRLARLLQRAQDPIQQRVLDQAMFATATTVLNQSKKIVPVDTGTLKASGRVEGPTRTNDSIEIEITYGGAAAGYAGYVHEIPKNYNNGKEFKYLEKPVMAYKDKFVRSVLARYANYLRKIK